MNNQNNSDLMASIDKTMVMHKSIGINYYITHKLKIIKCKLKECGVISKKDYSFLNFCNIKTN